MYGIRFCVYRNCAADDVVKSAAPNSCSLTDSAKNALSVVLFVDVGFASSPLMVSSSLSDMAAVLSND